MDRDSGVITHPKFRMWLRPDGIAQLVWAPRVAIVLEDATATIEAMEGASLKLLHLIVPQIPR